MKVFLLTTAILLISHVESFSFKSLFQSSYADCLGSYSALTWNAQSYCFSGKQLMDENFGDDFDRPFKSAPGPANINQPVSSVKQKAPLNKDCFTGELLLEIGKVKQMLLFFNCNGSRIAFAGEQITENKDQFFKYSLECSNCKSRFFFLIVTIFANEIFSKSLY